MPQIFQVLRCYKCLIFQVQQTKKANKFECKLCGEKQSIKRHYGIGTAKDCRNHVQKLNGIRGEIDELKESIDPDFNESELADISKRSNAVEKQTQKSKWSHFVENKEEEVIQTRLDNDTMYFNNTEVVLEMPKKRRKSNFRHPSIKMPPNTIDNHYYEKDNVDKTLGHVHVSFNAFKELEDTDEYRNNKIVKHEAKIEVKQEHIQSGAPLNLKKNKKEYVPLKINSISKWAQFVEEKQEDLKDCKNLFLVNESSVSQEESSDINKENSQQLFAEEQEVLENYQKNIIVNELNVSQIEHETYEEDLPSDRNTENLQQLFALCDDNNIDSVLDI